MHLHVSQVRIPDKLGTSVPSSLAEGNKKSLSHTFTGESFHLLFSVYSAETTWRILQSKQQASVTSTSVSELSVINLWKGIDLFFFLQILPVDLSLRENLIYVLISADCRSCLSFTPSCGSDQWHSKTLTRQPLDVCGVIKMDKKLFCHSAAKLTVNVPCDWRRPPMEKFAGHVTAYTSYGAVFSWHFCNIPLW